MNAWYYVIFFSAVAWAALSAGSVFGGGALSTPLNVASVIVCVLLSLTAGRWAVKTWIADAVAWLTHVHPAMAALTFTSTLLLLAVTLVLPKKDSWRAVPVAAVITFAWVSLVPLLVRGGIPGTAPDYALTAIGEITQPIIDTTMGWFG